MLVILNLHVACVAGARKGKGNRARARCDARVGGGGGIVQYYSVCLLPGAV